MIVLGIESATALCGVALVASGAVQADTRIVQKNVHAEKLLTLVDEVLRKSGRTLHEVSGIAISIGPGSFTGLRIGLSVAKGLSYKQIAERLFLSHRTVQNHVQNTLRKLQLHNRVQLVRYAIAQGLDDPDAPPAT